MFTRELQSGPFLALKLSGDYSGVVNMRAANQGHIFSSNFGVQYVGSKPLGFSTEDRPFLSSYKRSVENLELLSSPESGFLKPYPRLILDLFSNNFMAQFHDAANSYQELNMLVSFIWRFKKPAIIVTLACSLFLYFLGNKKIKRLPIKSYS